MSLWEDSDPRRLASSIDAVLAAPPIAHELARAVAHLDWPLVAYVRTEVRSIAAHATAGYLRGASASHASMRASMSG